jgi:hypothetical protein
MCSGGLGQDVHLPERREVTAAAVGDWGRGIRRSAAESLYFWRGSRGGRRQRTVACRCPGHSDGSNVGADRLPVARFEACDTAAGTTSGWHSITCLRRERTGAMCAQTRAYLRDASNDPMRDARASAGVWQLARL